MKYDYDVVIIGVGSAGMIAGEVAAKMGVKAALVERHRVGGDCPWTGCVPSKALLASAKVAHTMRHADKYGLVPAEGQFDSTAVWQRIRAIQREIAETDDDPDKYAGLGVDLLWGEARFEGEHRVRAGDRVVTAKYALVCTGSRPAAVPLDGLAGIGHLTSENVFELERAPRSLIIIGGGPIGIEMAQGMNRLGVKTTVLQRAGRILERDEPELAEILAARPGRWLAPTAAKFHQADTLSRSKPATRSCSISYNWCTTLDVLDHLSLDERSLAPTHG